MLHVLELLGNIALAVGQGLLADVGLRHLVIVGLRDFNVIPKDFVEADLQRLDAGLLFLRCLQLGDDALGVGEDLPQLVHVLVVPGPDDAPLPHGEGRLVEDASGDEVCQVRQPRELLPQAGQEHGGLVRQIVLQLRQAAQPGSQRHEIPCPGGAVDDAGDEPFQVRNLPQNLRQLFPFHGMVHQPAHGVQPPGDGHGVEQGPLQPAAELPPAHGGLGLVQHPEEGAFLLLAPERLGQLQIAPGHGVQLQNRPVE